VKKGEIEELNEQLRKFINNRSDFEKTEVLKKIISSMTLGMDMSDLFNTIIMASRTPDLVQKKMIYLYLSQYAKENQEMSILAINSILLDTKDSSPMIRGLALRWLCNMAYASFPSAFSVRIYCFSFYDCFLLLYYCLLYYFYLLVSLVLADS
jgi:AP-4 complex subunit beta-1